MALEENTLPEHARMVTSARASIELRYGSAEAPEANFAYETVLPGPKPLHKVFQGEQGIVLVPSQPGSPSDSPTDNASKAKESPAESAAKETERPAIQPLSRAINLPSRPPKSLRNRPSQQARRLGDQPRWLPKRPRIPKTCNARTRPPPRWKRPW